MHLRRLSTFLVIFALPLARTTAQVGSTTDILTGLVTNTAGAPIPGATIEARSVETQVTRRTRTNSDGRYTILLRRVVYVKRFARESRVGFGAAA